MKCIICGSSNLKYINTMISDFVMSRIRPEFRGGDIENIKTDICFCRDCTVAFYKYRLTDEEIDLLYAGYRDESYQREREEYECWYTAHVNDALNHDELMLTEQKRILTKIVRENIHFEIKSALDYGGNEGRTFTEELGTCKKYVYDISNVQTIEGVESISSQEELKKLHFDFVMCNHTFEHVADPLAIIDLFLRLGTQDTFFYIEVPSENPFLKGDKFAIKNQMGLLTNRHLSKIRLIKSYLKQRKQPFMPMKEHINFFSEKSFRVMAENHGFEVITIEENVEKNVLGNVEILSMLFKKRNN